MGIPVYLHYCGGELEKINYVLKSNSCCGGEDDDASDCCKDENFVIQNTTDFTIKHFHRYDVVKTFCDLFYVSLPFSVVGSHPITAFVKHPQHEPPGRLRQQLVISTSVLRI